MNIDRLPEKKKPTLFRSLDDFWLSLWPDKPFFSAAPVGSWEAHDVFDPRPESSRSFAKGLYVRPFIDALETYFDFVNPPQDFGEFPKRTMPLGVFGFLINQHVALNGSQNIYSTRQINRCLSLLPKAFEILEGFGSARLGQSREKVLVFTPYDLEPAFAARPGSGTDAPYLLTPLTRQQLILPPPRELHPLLTSSFGMYTDGRSSKRYRFHYWHML